jgi:predicted NUDIX family NTP pyrophosphohydrolase
VRQQSLVVLEIAAVKLMEWSPPRVCEMTSFVAILRSTWYQLDEIRLLVPRTPEYME